jgi:hypothetical protein
LALLAPYLVRRLKHPSGWLTLQANVQAQAWVDDEAVGALPVKHLHLSAGGHSVRMQNRALGLERRTSVAVNPSRETVDAESFAKGMLEIQASAGTQVWLDGERVALPSSPVSVWEGRHLVLCRGPHREEQITSEILPGATTPVRCP